MKPALQQITDRICERSAPLRRAYLARVAQMAARPRGSDRIGCANVAHAVAAMPVNDKPPSPWCVSRARVPMACPRKRTRPGP